MPVSSVITSTSRERRNGQVTLQLPVRGIDFLPGSGDKGHGFVFLAIEPFWAQHGSVNFSLPVSMLSTAAPELPTGEGHSRLRDGQWSQSRR